MSIVIEGVPVKFCATEAMPAVVAYPVTVATPAIGVYEDIPATFAYSATPELVAIPDACAYVTIPATVAKFALMAKVAVSANPAVPDVVDTPATFAYADVVENPEVYANPTVSAAETVTLPPNACVTDIFLSKFILCATPTSVPLSFITTPEPVAVTPVRPEPSPTNVPVVIPVN